MKRILQILLSLILVTVSACGQNMIDQEKFKPLAGTPFFADGRSARVPVDGSVARGHLNENELLHTGMIDGKLSDSFPIPVTEQLLARGRERYTIFCAPCHGASGEGNGLVVQRGFKTPPSYLDERLRAVPAGHFVDVMKVGIGQMSSYADRVNAADRWAIAGYIRALQLASRMPTESLDAKDRERLDEAERAALVSQQAAAGASRRGASHE